MREAKAYRGQCLCGAVQFVLNGEPTGMGYCLCDSCCRWAAGPVDSFTLWKTDALRVVRGADDIGTYNNGSHGYRKWCRSCGGHLFTEHPDMGLIHVHTTFESTTFLS